MAKSLRPEISAAERERLFQEGIDHFGRGEFFAAHEVWETIWLSQRAEPRDLFQGLIQVAAAMHQFHDLRRTLGPRNTLAKAWRHLEPYSPSTLGLDLAALLESVRVWRLWLEAPGGEPPPPPTLRRQGIP